MLEAPDALQQPRVKKGPGLTGEPNARRRREVGAEYRNLARRCRNPWFAFRSVCDVLGLLGRAAMRRSSAPMRFYPDEVKRAALALSTASPPHDPISKAVNVGRGELQLASGVLRYEGEPQWNTQFDDDEQFESLHRWNWLLAPLSDSPRRTDLWAWGTELMRGWVRFNEGATTGERWRPYAMGERISNACLFRFLVHPHAPLPASVEACLRQTALILAGRLEYFGDEATGNHVINEARGLFYAGYFLKVDGAVRIAEAVLRAQLPVLVAVDGFLREGSSHYQFIFTRWILEIRWLAELAGINALAQYLSGVAEQLVKRCWFFLVASPDGWRMPLLGDISPDFPPGWLLTLPWSSHARNVFQPTRIPERPASRGWAEMWECDRRANPAVSLTKSREVATGATFPGSFWHRVECHEFTLLCHAEPQRRRRRATHRHGDLTGFVLYYRGAPLLIDCGRANYIPTDRLGTYGLSALAHNSVLVDGCEPQAPVSIPRLPGFYRANRLSTSFRETMTGAALELVHDGFGRLAGDRVIHTRTWEFREGEFWIEDSFAGENPHEIETIFHWALDIRVELTDNTGANGTIAWQGGNQRGLLTRSGFTKESDKRLLVRRAETDPELAGWCSENYGESQPCTTVTFIAKLSLPGSQRFSLKVL